MKHLKKITISNARRFAKDISIDFGQGATILLASNGTGKTTVFEAIEFALTGAVQRLNKPPLSLIRDNEEGVDVRLDFEDDLFCEVNYRKGSDPVLTGNHDVIFKSRNIDEIPYLLRLTHLLEQRGANWFVQQPDSNKAGDLLDKLSIGKELNRISGSKTSAIRAANVALERAGDLLKGTKEKLDTFQRLILARTNAKTDFKLQSLTELIEKIINIHLLSNETRPVLEEKLSTIISFTAQTESQLNSKAEVNSEFIVKLAKGEGFFEEYLLNKKLLVVSQTLLKDVSLSVDSSKKELEKIDVELKERTTKENEYKIKHSTLIGLRDCFMKIEGITMQNQDVEKEITEYNRIIPTTKKKLESVLKIIELANGKNDKHKLLAEQLEALAKSKGELKSKETLVTDWQGLISKIETISNSTLPSLQLKQKEQTDLLQTVKGDVEVLEQEFTKSQDLANSLKNASDSISSAVSMIANNLPKDRGDCPVCYAKYSPEELQTRISKAVSYIDPLLNDAVSKNKSANDKMIEYKAQYNELQEQLVSLNKGIDELSKQKRTFEATITENVIPNFPGLQSTKEALEYVKVEIAKVESNIGRIQTEKLQLGNFVEFEELESLTLTKQKHEREIEQLNAALQGSLSKQLTLNEELNNLKIQFGANLIEEIRKNIVETENSLIQNSADAEKTKQSMSITQNSILEKEKLVTAENTKIAQINNRQNEINAEWLEIGLKGEPNSDTLTNKRKSLSKEKVTLNKGKETLKKINEELAKWKIAEEFEKYDKEIKALCGAVEEPEHLKQLSSSTEKAQKKYSQIDEKIKTLKNLYTQIGAELETTHGYLKEINPRWNALLSRVVVNPRFAETSLNSYNYRNKPQAEVNVIMHGSPTKVIDMASEAQITDIQLTFMLAMANTYQWTSWKGLLLDDPTQHHDLVHSASVFDLLRDFIINDDYQILLGTHDSIHANFFKRKLNNDGIIANIWSLTSDNDGVKAIQL